jgi:hypothetical protein
MNARDRRDLPSVHRPANAGARAALRARSEVARAVRAALP